MMRVHVHGHGRVRAVRQFVITHDQEAFQIRKYDAEQQPADAAEAPHLARWQEGYEHEECPQETPTIAPDDEHFAAQHCSQGDLLQDMKHFMLPEGHGSGVWVDRACEMDQGEHRMSADRSALPASPPAAQRAEIMSRLTCRDTPDVVWD